MTQPQVQTNEFPRTTQAALLARGETLTTKTEIGRGFNPRYLVLGRMAWERVALTSIVYEGQAMVPAMRQQGNEQLFELPESDPKRIRLLEVTWVNRAMKATQFSFHLTEGVGTAQGAPAVRGPNETPRALPAQAARPPLAAPSMSASASPRPVMPQVPVPKQNPPTDLETQIAESFAIRWEALRTIVDNVAARHAVDAAALLEFFGADGFSTIEPDWLEQTRQRAVAANLVPGELQAAQVFLGVARTIGERREFEDLMAEARKGDGVKQSGDDFQVMVATDRADGSVQVSEQKPEPRLKPAPKGGVYTTGAQLLEVAKAFEVDPSWLLLTIKSIAELRAVSPDELAAALTPSVIRFGKAAFAQKVEVGLAIESPEPNSDAARYQGASEAERPAMLNQFIAVAVIATLAHDQAEAV